MLVLSALCSSHPNLAKMCYLNSSLQSLLALTPFVQEVCNQHRVWSSHPEAKLIRCCTSLLIFTVRHISLAAFCVNTGTKANRIIFLLPPVFSCLNLFRHLMDVQCCRMSNNLDIKKMVLAAFKETVSNFNPEFEDDNQKVSVLFVPWQQPCYIQSNYLPPLKCFPLCDPAQDAHEFLIAVLTQLRFLSQKLHLAAIGMGVNYTCPVSAHIIFKMLTTRTCKRYEHVIMDSLYSRSREDNHLVRQWVRLHGPEWNSFGCVCKVSHLCVCACKDILIIRNPILLSWRL